MAYDVELMRELMLALEDRQQSPRAPVVISLDQEAIYFGCEPDDVGFCLNVLLELDYIDGPGTDEPGFWLFRKLTRKGNKFVDEVRFPEDWQRVKLRYRRLDADPAY